MLLVLASFLLCHWFACAFHMVARLEPADAITWVDQYYNVYSPAVENPGAFDIYIVALYFSIVTLTTTGYGDVLAVTHAGALALAPAFLRSHACQCQWTPCLARRPPLPALG